MSGELVVATNKQNYQLEGMDQEQKFVTMRVEGQTFGIAVKVVQDVLRRQRIARVPLAPKVVAGSLNLRGRIVTAIDMRVRLGMPPFEDITSAMHVVVEYKNELYSLVVDGVGDVLSLPMKNFERAPSNLSESWRSLSMGVFKLDKQLLVILDVQHIIWGK